MRRVILQQFVTVDGFAAGPNGELDLLSTFAGDTKDDIDRDSVAFMQHIDLILLGATTYRMFAAFWPTDAAAGNPMAEPINETPKAVFSNTMKHAPWGKWGNAAVVEGDAIVELVKLKQQPGKDMVLWGSITLARAFIRERLIDEYQLRVCPVAIGSGMKLFPEDIGQLDLRLLETKAYESGLVMLRYEPREGAKP